jgi:thiamine-phosphate pyrophosphorylase
MDTDGRMKIELPPVYPITDKELARRSSHLGILKDLVRGGARLVQIRDKRTPLRELIEDIHDCVRFAAEQGVRLIINDRSDLALSCGADGVHLGRDDLPPEAARSILGDRKIIGCSTHSITQARSASLLPVHYIGFGPVFETRTKDQADPALGLAKLKTACRISAVPVVAIGGIDLMNVRKVLECGASSAAVISSLMSAHDIAEKMQEFLEAAMGR